MSAHVGERLARIDWWLVLLAASVGVVGVLFIKSATLGHDTADQASKQVLFLCAGGLLGALTVAIPYARFRRSAHVIYGIALLGLFGLPWFGYVINGGRRWYLIFGFGLQPSEFAKLGVIIALAGWLRFRDKARTFEGLIVPVLITAVPVVLVFRQPDLGSSLVFWPILLAMCYAAGTSLRSLAVLVAAGAVGLVAAWFTLLHDYQRTRVLVWWEHFGWDRTEVATDPAVREILLVHGYQPWQSLIAIGSGGWTGFGYQRGPQSRFDFLPYRSGDYIYAVVMEELGLWGGYGLMLLLLGLVFALLGVALRTRERFGRLVAVGVAAWIGAQSFLHIAVCAWALPATGLPMPLVSAGGSSTVAVLLGIALVIGIGYRNEPVLARDGFS